MSSDYEEGEEMSAAETTPTYRSEDQLRALVEIVEVARAVPMSASVMINRDEVLDLLDDVLAHLPDELRAARWLLKERDEILAKAERDAVELIDDAKSRVAQMVQRQEIVKTANHEAQAIRDAAEADARRLKHEAEDYCDQRLARLEVVLDRLTKTVVAGRRKLAGTIAEAQLADTPAGLYEDAENSEAAAFFDQEAD